MGWSGSAPKSHQSGERSRLGDALKKLKGKDEEKAEALIVAQALCDREGNRLFSDEDATLLAEKDSVVIDRLAQRVLTLNGMSPDADEDAKKN